MLTDLLIVQIIVGAVLILFTILDVKNKEIPSLYTTGLIFFLIVIFGLEGLMSGAVSFILGWLLVDADFFSGTADLKLLTAMGIMIPFRWVLLTFLVIFMFYGIVYKILIVKIMKHKGEIAFVPVILCTYITHLLVMYIL